MVEPYRPNQRPSEPSRTDDENVGRAFVAEDLEQVFRSVGFAIVIREFSGFVVIRSGTFGTFL
jgi:hypothetical protein